MSGRLVNWAGNVEFQAAAVHRPDSLEQVRSLVGRHEKVRALGSAHSFNDIADTSGLLLSLSELPADVEIDGDASTVRITGGVRYAELGRRLHAAGYALHNLASLPHISVAGSVATGTHGSGDRNGNLSTAVAALEIVTADGDLVTLERERDGDRFRGAVVGLGAFGVVVGVTLDIAPTFDMRQYVFENLPFDVLSDHFTDVFSSAYSVSMFTSWRGPMVDQVWVKRLDDQTEVWPTEEDWFGARPADQRLHPVPGISAEPCTEQMGASGPWFERLPHFRADFTPSVGEELQSEYLVPRRHAVDALRVIDSLRDRVAPVLQISEIRTIAADDLWMSPSYEQDSVGIHFTWIRDTRAVLPVLGLLDEHLAPFEPRPHWGKLFAVPPRVMRSRYPRLDDFRALVREYDPAGKFTNDFLRRYVF